MVYAFLLLNFVTPNQVVELLYSQVFGEQTVDSVVGMAFSEEDLPAESSVLSPPASRCHRKTCLQKIANRVAVEYSFLYSVSGKNRRDEIERLRVDGILPEFISGTFGIPSTPMKCVVWCGALGNCCAALVLESEENRLLADAVVRLIFKYVQEYVRILNNPRDAQLKPDYVMVILKHFLPSGRMTFANGRVTRQYEKELEKSMNILMSCK